MSPNKRNTTSAVSITAAASRGLGDALDPGGSDAARRQALARQDFGQPGDGGEAAEQDLGAYRRQVWPGSD
jgi:hypothetical protein